MAKKKPNTAPKTAASSLERAGSKKPLPEIIPGQKHTKYLAAILCLLCIALYANTIPNGYVADDAGAVFKNKIVQQGINGIPELLKTDFFYGAYGYTSSKYSYRPVSLTSFAIEHSLWGDNPHISHAINVLLFMLTVVLLFYLLQKILPAPKGGARLRIITAFVISALFAAHPIHTEVVGYIKSRDEIFSFLFLLLAMWYAVKYEKGSGTLRVGKGTSGTLGPVAIAALFFFLALMSKESAISFVAIIPFTLFYFLKAKKRLIVTTSFALVVAMAVYLALRISIFGDLIDSKEKYDIIDNFMQPMSFTARLPVAIAIIGKYMLKLVFPHPLSFDYSYNVIPAYIWGSWEFIVSLLICIGLIVYAIYKFRKRSILGYSIIFFFISIFVVSNIFFVIGNAFAERFMYVPSLAFCIGVGYAIMYFYKPHKKSIFTYQSFSIFCLSGILVFYSIKTISRNKNWKDNYTLFSHDVEYANKSERIHNLLGQVCKEMSDTEKIASKKDEMLFKAQKELETAHNIYPDDESAAKSLIAIENMRGENEKAIALLGNSNVKLNKGTAELYYNLGNVLADDKNYTAAIAKYKMALMANPQLGVAYINLGNTYQKMRFYDSAITVLNKGISIDPNMANAYQCLGFCYLQLNDYSLTIKNYTIAIKIDPNILEAYRNLAYAYFKIGNEEKAKEYKNLGDEIAAKNNIPH